MPRMRYYTHAQATRRPDLRAIGFIATRDLFRANGMDLYSDHVEHRFIARNADVTYAVFETIDQARAWLAARPPAQTPARCAR